ncbi:hypothetical protein BP5796_00361 [Coleophoma crateriformis]|uniref:Uncharacterized protein n=1 Tax=Coleophoma crateriformis TaxID=565419 RepID=A0A3D8T9B4_9HELO|nr:hypothetical protein BP5796_00361 [Coleophoma crateriformis]
MKFSATPLIALLSLSSQVISAPVAEPEPLSVALPDITASINNYLAIAITLLNTDLAAITGLANAATGDLSAQLQVVLKADLLGLADQIQIAGYTIGNATALAVTSLSDKQITTLGNTVTNLQTYIAAFERALTTSYSKLSVGMNFSSSSAVLDVIERDRLTSPAHTASRTLLLSEFQAVQAALPSLYTPIVKYAKAVSAVSHGSQSSLKTFIYNMTGSIKTVLLNLGVNVTL